MLEEIAGLVDTLLEEEGQAVIYWSVKTRNSTPLTMALMSQQSTQVDLNGNIVEVMLTDFKCRSSDLPNNPERNDKITIVSSGAVYEVRPVGNGKPYNTISPYMTRIHTQQIAY